MSSTFKLWASNKYENVWVAPSVVHSVILGPTFTWPIDKGGGRNISEIELRFW